MSTVGHASQQAVSVISVPVISHITDVVVHMPLCLHALFTRDVPKANCLRQGLVPMPPPLPCVLQNLQNMVLNPQPNVQPAAQPAAGQPIPLAPDEHVQPLMVKYSCQKKWKAGPVCHRVEHASLANVVVISATSTPTGSTPNWSRPMGLYPSWRCYHTPKCATSKKKCFSNALGYTLVVLEVL